MKREDYIKAVKVKLDEISPFDEPNNFIAADDDADFADVKPIVSYIEDTLDKASWFCLNSLPVSLLALDADSEEHYVNISSDGVGVITGIDDYIRPLRVHDNTGNWKRDVTSFITSSSPTYLLQQSKYTRGGVAKPVVAYVPENQTLELYSFPTSLYESSLVGGTTAQLTYIECNKPVQYVLSHIEDFIVLRCAAYVEEILGDTNAAQQFLTEMAAKVELVLK